MKNKILEKSNKEVEKFSYDLSDEVFAERTFDFIISNIKGFDILKNGNFPGTDKVLDNLLEVIFDKAQILKIKEKGIESITDKELVKTKNNFVKQKMQYTLDKRKKIPDYLIAYNQIFDLLDNFTLLSNKTNKRNFLGENKAV